MTTAEYINTIAMNGFAHRAQGMAAQYGNRVGENKYEFFDGSWISFNADGSMDIGG